MPIRRFRIPSTLVVTTLALPACGTSPAPNDAGGNDAADANTSDAMDCLQICNTYDQTSCSSTCGVQSSDAGPVCTGDPNCHPISDVCCCCLVA